MSYQFPPTQFNTMDSSNGSGQQPAMDAGSVTGNGSAPAPFTATSGNIQAGSDGSRTSKSTLWMGEIDPSVNENEVAAIWKSQGHDVTVKMIRDKFSGNHAGYCFVDFDNADSAMAALSLNGSSIPNTNRQFKLNWASGGGATEKKPEFSIFVGDLGSEVTDYTLLSVFQGRYDSCTSAKVMTDPNTNVSRGYGFVRFSNQGDQIRALNEMQGAYVGNRSIRVSTATPKNRALGNVDPNRGMAPNGPPVGMYPMGAPSPMNFYNAPQPMPMNQFTDPNNTTVFVGGLSGYVTEDELRSFFQGFGDITYVKIPPGKGCGFVQFVQRHAAEMAINQMQGYPIGNSRVRLSWGRSQNNSGPAGAPYRPAPPPPVYPTMPLPPQNHFGNFAPLNSVPGPFGVSLHI